MTITVTIPEANQQFSQLMRRVLLGEEIIICENGIAVATITPSQRKRQPRVAGQDKGKISIAPDFNAPLPDDILVDFLG
ncbi:type II toxin-antitoxin system Phd/YefM family antitoxin [Pseudanabaena mucicola]|uniref:Type II toxin-antitoxin system Phd/YefM family antitoxin n=1 Tax=Pseudanabaena mucicola FACHB-723 TaxID=2692860 RepID=A0ABR7ZWY9_9CYAN|nr:type II toxin-antitoxin system Phd/YefM family antitoxin [Pseudanabaena mucicola]MBD2187995.1 type II toxin-antitoxin system Phd/YefM family antitoxin [Pseudanabaena mucicola FACHB-723]